MHIFALECPSIGSGEMPEPKDRAAQHPHKEWRHEPMCEAVEANAAPYPADAVPSSQGKSPQSDQRRAARDPQWRRHHQEDQMLHHVGGE